MLAILVSLNARNLPIFQPILKVLVSKFMVHRALSDKTYLSLGLLSPLTKNLEKCHTKTLYSPTIYEPMNGISALFRYFNSLTAKLKTFEHLTLYLLVSSGDNFCKQFGFRSGPTKCRA